MLANGPRAFGIGALGGGATPGGTEAILQPEVDLGRGPLEPVLFDAGLALIRDTLIKSPGRKLLPKNKLANVLRAFHEGSLLKDYARYIIKLMKDKLRNFSEKPESPEATGSQSGLRAHILKEGWSGLYCA